MRINNSPATGSFLVSAVDSNQLRRFPCLPEVDSLPYKIDCNMPAKVTALMRDSYYQR